MRSNTKLSSSENSQLRCASGGYRDPFGMITSNSLFDDKKREVCSICGLHANDSSDSPLQPEIVTPSMVKALGSRLYQNLWGAAGSKIREATHIIFIGYSFPIADFEFRYLLQRNVPPNARIDVVLYKNDNPEQTDLENLRDLLPEKRYRDAFPKNEMYFYYEGFGDYFSK